MKPRVQSTSCYTSTPLDPIGFEVRAFQTIPLAVASDDLHRWRRSWQKLMGDDYLERWNLVTELFNAMSFRNQRNATCTCWSCTTWRTKYRVPLRQPTRRSVRCSSLRKRRRAVTKHWSVWRRSIRSCSASYTQCKFELSTRFSLTTISVAAICLLIATCFVWVCLRNTAQCFRKTAASILGSMSKIESMALSEVIWCV